MSKKVINLLVGIGLVGVGYFIAKCKDLSSNVEKKGDDNTDKVKGWGYFTRECEEEVLDKGKYAQCEHCQTCNRCFCKNPFDCELDDFNDKVDYADDFHEDEDFSDDENDI